MRRFLFFILVLEGIYSNAQTEFPVAINELNFSMSSSWVELYNYGDATVELSECYFTDKTSNTTKWKLKSPISIDSKSFIVIKLDSNNVSNFSGIQEFMVNTVFLYAKSKTGIIYIDEMNFTNIGNAKFCRIPDGLGKIIKTNKPTPNAKNEVRDVLIFTLTPNVAYGISKANFRQTQGEYNTDVGLFNTRGLDFSITFWKRYRAILGLNYSKFRYSFSAEDRLEKTTGFYVDEVIGKQKSRWADVKFPLIYNSVRVHDDFYVDFGFLISIQTDEHLKYKEFRHSYTNDDELISTKETYNYDSDDYEGDGTFKMPLTMRISYNYKEKYEVFTSYYLRKDRDSKVEGTKRNLKSALYFGLAYNFNYLRLR